MSQRIRNLILVQAGSEDGIGGLALRSGAEVVVAHGSANLCPGDGGTRISAHRINHD